MKIGILTLPFNNNYGGFLQAYSLMTVLKKEGHDVELIYRRNNRWSKGHIIKKFVKNVIKRLCGLQVKSIKPNQEENYQTRGVLIHQFVDKYIVPRTEPIYSTHDMYDQIIRNNYDYVIIGSDQVWRADYGQRHVQDFFLAECSSSRPLRIAYAASFGTNDPYFSRKEIIDCKLAINRFKAVSVREDNGIQVIKNLGWSVKKEVKVVLDPTLLLKKEHYLNLIVQNQQNKKRRLFCYILDYNSICSDIINIISEEMNESPYFILDSKKWKTEDYQMPSMEDWLSGIRDADFVITDSYHGMLFSVIFEKPFLVITNYSRGADRFVSFLKKINLESRLICGKENAKKILNQQIDWNRTYELLEKEISKSINFLKENIK